MLGHNAIVMRLPILPAALAALLATALLLPSACIAAAVVGEPAPALALPTAGDARLALPELRGKVVYVDFWASWCGPCKRSFPWMNELVQRYGKDGFAGVAVNVDRKRSDAERFLAQVPAQFTVVYDSAGVTPAAWAVKGMPSSFLIDRKGRVAAVTQGFRDDEKAGVEQHIRELLAAR